MLTVSAPPLEFKYCEFPRGVTLTVRNPSRFFPSTPGTADAIFYMFGLLSSPKHYLLFSSRRSHQSFYIVTHVPPPFFFSDSRFFPLSPYLTFFRLVSIIPLLALFYSSTPPPPPQLQEPTLALLLPPNPFFVSLSSICNLFFFLWSKSKRS